MSQDPAPSDGQSEDEPESAAEEARPSKSEEQQPPGLLRRVLGFFKQKPAAAAPPDEDQQPPATEAAPLLSTVTPPPASEPRPHTAQPGPGAGSSPTEAPAGETTEPEPAAPAPDIMAQLEDLPSSYGQDFARLSLVGPERLYLFWELSEQSFARIERPGFRFLRHVLGRGVELERASDIAAQGSWYLFSQPDGLYQVELGELRGDAFHVLLRSNFVSTPALRPRFAGTSIWRVREPATAEPEAAVARPAVRVDQPAVRVAPPPAPALSPGPQAVITDPVPAPARAAPAPEHVWRSFERPQEQAALHSDQAAREAPAVPSEPPAPSGLPERGQERTLAQPSLRLPGASDFLLEGPDWLVMAPSRREDASS